ncbi:MAG: tetratricopeptide repeat protein, partial [Desulfobulbaceae bacterium]|nr:tetratricopeptide repeat protein [Desulfobulbaceae bacterium]
MMTWYAEQLNSAGKLTKAERVYQRAIELNPLYPPAWLGLAGLRDDTGDKEHANQLLDFIATKTKDVQRWAWNKNLLAYRFGRTDILAIELPYIINTVPGKTRDDAIRMAFSIWPTLAELREHLPDQMPALFNYAVRSGRLEQALIVWPTIAT